MRSTFDLWFAAASAAAFSAAAFLAVSFLRSSSESSAASQESRTYKGKGSESVLGSSRRVGGARYIIIVLFVVPLLLWRDTGDSADFFLAALGLIVCDGAPLV
jgi:hypothetical protein